MLLSSIRYTSRYSYVSEMAPPQSSRARSMTAKSGKRHGKATVRNCTSVGA